MKKLAFLMMAFVSVIFLTGCPSKEPETINLGTIPEKYLATVPYVDGEVFYLQHEGDRLLIPFHVSRHRYPSQGNDVWGFDYNDVKYKPSPSVYFNYEVDITTCKPEYPLFDIDISFSNSYMADSIYYEGYDSHHKYAQLTCMNIFASIPLIGEHNSYVTVLDTFEVNGHAYHEVFQYDNEQQNMQGIYIESLYYNYENGVIAVVMSNHEKYTLYEEE